MSPIEIFRIAMALLAFYGPGADMGCNDVMERATACWVRNERTHTIARIAPTGISYERTKPVVPMTPTPAPKGGSK